MTYAERDRSILEIHYTRKLDFRARDGVVPAHVFELAQREAGVEVYANELRGSDFRGDLNAHPQTSAPAASQSFGRT
jgi:hypothetical protein